MKRIIMLMAIASIVFVLFGCNQKPSPNNVQPTDTSVTSTQTTQVITSVQETVTTQERTQKTLEDFMKEGCRVYQNVENGADEYVDEKGNYILPIVNVAEKEYIPIKPQSNYSNLSELKNYLMNWYTEKMIDSIIFNKECEYKDFDGHLYYYSAPNFSVLINWDSAVIKNLGSKNGVESLQIDVVDQDGQKIICQVELLNGKIDSVVMSYA